MNKIYGFMVGAFMILGAHAHASALPETAGADTSLIIAAGGGCAHRVHALLTAGADVNAPDAWGNTTLIMACADGSREVVRLLLDARADTTTRGSSEKTALDHAVCSRGWLDSCVRDRIEIVRLLHKGSVDLGMQTYLLGAVKEGDVCLVRQLLAQGVSPNACEPIGARWQILDFDTALMIAARYGFADIVRVLLEAGTDVDMQSLRGRTALIEACTHARLDVVRLLLTAHADVNKSDIRGESALFHVIEVDSDIHKVKVREDGYYRVQLNMQSLLQEIDNRREIVTLLLKSPVHLDMRRKGDKNTVLMKLNSGNGGCFNDSYYLDNKGEIEKFHCQVMKMVLVAGASVNVQSNSGRTALLLGDRSWSSTYAKQRMLLLAGAYLTIKDVWGRTHVSDLSKSYSEFLKKVVVEKMLWERGKALSAELENLLPRELCALVKNYEHEKGSYGKECAFLDERLHTLALRRRALGDLVGLYVQGIDALADLVSDYEAEKLIGMPAESAEADQEEKEVAGARSYSSAGSHHWHSPGALFPQVSGW